MLDVAYIMVAAVLTITPAEELRAAVDDISTNVAPLERSGTRYASFLAVPVAQRAEAAAVLGFVLNTVSRASVIIPIEEVPGTSSRLFRIPWDRYGLPREAWEEIVSEDPYWHQRLRRVNGPDDVYIDGAWLSPPDAAALRAHTTSAGALLRGDFLIARMSTTLDGGHYYRLAGIPESERAFFRALGIDAKTIGKLGADAGANLIYSRVTHKVRRIVRRPSPLGGAWHTYDVERSLVENDPLRNPFDFRYDAGEHIAAAPNGLHRFALYDARGKRQDAVPDKIAKDASDPHGAGIIAPMLSCVRCHVEDGLRPFENDQQRLLSGNIDLLAANPPSAERLADFYGSSLLRPLERDREDYAGAVRTATAGLSVREVASAIGRHYAAYVDELVTPAQAAQELGIAENAMSKILRDSHDPVLLALFQGIAVQREQWIAAFAEAALRSNNLTPEKTP